MVGGCGVLGLVATQASSFASKVLLIDYRKGNVARRAPIGVYNLSEGKIVVSLGNDPGRRAAKVIDVVHRLRAAVGIGLTNSELHCGEFGELRPPVGQHAHWFA